MTPPPLYGKTALVTGGTAGIGLETALGLARLGAEVTVVGRDPGRGDRAVEWIRAESGNDAVAFAAADLSSQGQVRALAQRFAAEHARLDLLVNNAGGLYPERRETEDGVEATLALAHLAPVLLTHLLLPRLRAGAPARIVNVSAGVHRWARVRWDDLASARGYRAVDAHARAKLLNLLWSNELARRLRGTGITVVAANPGTAWTGMTESLEPGMMPPSLRMLWPLARPLARGRSARAAARAPLVAATSRDVVGGAYVGPRGRPGRGSRAAHDGELALRAWNVTAELLGMDPEQLAAGRAPARKKTPEVPRFRVPRLAPAAAAA